MLRGEEPQFWVLMNRTDHQHFAEFHVVSLGPVSEKVQQRYRYWHRGDGRETDHHRNRSG